MMAVEEILCRRSNNPTKEDNEEESLVENPVKWNEVHDEFFLSRKCSFSFSYLAVPLSKKEGMRSKR